MFRKPSTPSTFFVAVTIIVFSIAVDAPCGDINRVEVGSYPDAEIANENMAVKNKPESTNKITSLGFDKGQGRGPGLTVGTTTFDYQSNGRMNRQVDWRGSEHVHFGWTRQDDLFFGGDRGTGYNYWDSDENEHGLGIAGCNVHPRLGLGHIYSGYAGLDVNSSGSVIFSNHHDEGAGFASTIWPDYLPGSCMFSPYRDRMNDPPGGRYLWPSHEHHETMGGDEVEHVFARDINLPNNIMYFRRVNGVWDVPPVFIDANMENVSQTVTSSRVSDKVALVWIANLPAVPGGTPAVNSGRQRDNDVYYMLSNDAGITWQPMVNVTASDPTLPGWRAHTDLSCLFDSQDNLHIVWNAREYSPNPQPNGSFPHFYGSRLFHWSNDPGQGGAIRTVKDANWDLPPVNFCFGGAWNEMSIVKPMISECDGKLYTLFVQFNDITNGIDNDCHISYLGINGDHSGTANGELYISVSHNNGFNWDAARNLTNSPTPLCNPAMAYNCDSDMWPSMSRYGMEVVTGDFTGVPIVDPSGGYAGNDYLDVLYIEDKYPGGCVQDAGAWTTNDVKWFRVPCVEPVPNPILVIFPIRINFPVWPVPAPAKKITPVDISVWSVPGVQLDVKLRLENIGNVPLTINSISVAELTGPPGWMDVSNYGPIIISHLLPNHYDLTVSLNVGGIVNTVMLLEGMIIINSDSRDRGFDTVFVYLNVSEGESSTQWADIRSGCTRISFNNTGNIGHGGNLPNGGYNMNFLNDCDVTENEDGYDDNSNVVLRDASPFILRINEDVDTVLFTNIFYPDPELGDKHGVEGISDDGFMTQADIMCDSTGHADYQYGHTGKFMSKDSAIGYDVEYFAPTDPDSCGFIVVKETIYNNSQNPIDNVYIGRISDWNIPSDTSNDNGSDFDASRDLIYCYGAEYGPDANPNNDCVFADDRYGGIAYYNGYRLPYETENDSLPHPEGPLYTHLVAEWIDPEQGINGARLYEKIDSTAGYEIWTPAQPDSFPDSLYEDLHVVTVHGQFDLDVGDSLVIVTVMVNGYDGGVDEIEEITDKAFQWINDHAEIFSWPSDCDCKPGNANGDGTINIFDITYIIGYLYLGGPAPIPYELCNGDPNCDCVVNIFDVTYLISYLYLNGPPPCTCGDWLTACGPPLRK